MVKKTAVLLFNLGGPDGPEAVKPFLKNLFNDKHIISLPQPFRYCLASLISSRREKEAKSLYAYMGGGSPLLKNSQEQADLLQKSLGDDYKVFVVMRHWQPRASEVLDKVLDFSPDEILLLPLYPQFSKTTTYSSLEEWKAICQKNNVTIPTKTICCYPKQDEFVASHVQAITQSYQANPTDSPPRILFSAHGLPQKNVDDGDPYQWQVEQTAEAVMKHLSIPYKDWMVCYQSKVGPLEWLKPSTEDEIKRAGKEQVPILLIPIAFVSEHIETLVELDIEYKKLADEHKVPSYIRVPALNASGEFIQSLANLCLNATSQAERICPTSFSKCYKQLEAVG